MPESSGRHSGRSTADLTYRHRSIQDLKTNYLGNRNPRLHTDETLIALSICAASDDTAKAAVEQLKNLKGSEVHSSVILSQID